MYLGSLKNKVKTICNLDNQLIILLVFVIVKIAQMVTRRGHDNLWVTWSSSYKKEKENENREKI